MNHWSFDHGFQGWIKAGDSGEIFPWTFLPNNPNQKINTEILWSFSNPQHVRHLKHSKKNTWTLLKTKCWPQPPPKCQRDQRSKKNPPIRSSGWRSTDQSFRPQSDDPQRARKNVKFGIHWIWPPSQDASDHQDYYINIIGNPELNLHLWLLYTGWWVDLRYTPKK